MRLSLLFFGVFLLLSSCSEKETKIKPNVILILADDQGWGDLSIHGNPYVSTLLGGGTALPFTHK